MFVHKSITKIVNFHVPNQLPMSVASEHKDQSPLTNPNLNDCVNNTSSVNPIVSSVSSSNTPSTVVNSSFVSSCSSNTTQTHTLNPNSPSTTHPITTTFTTTNTNNNNNDASPSNSASCQNVSDKPLTTQKRRGFFDFFRSSSSSSSSLSESRNTSVAPAPANVPINKVVTAAPAEKAVASAPCPINIPTSASSSSSSSSSPLTSSSASSRTGSPNSSVSSNSPDACLRQSISPRKEKTKSVIIFDWDDTLLASSELASKGVRLDSKLDENSDIARQLKQLETSVVAVLTEALSCAEVHIITNAELGWVELSTKKFLPAVLPLLPKLNVLSARSAYERTFPDSPYKWKLHAYRSRLATTFSTVKGLKNILCFGDSTIERDAIRAATKGVPNVRTKSVKFAERPSLEQLQKQIEMLHKNFNYIHNQEADLDLMLTLSVQYTNKPSPAAKQATPPATSQPCAC